MSDVLRTLSQRRMELVARSTQQRQQLVQAWGQSQRLRAGGGLWGPVWRWRWPLVMLLAPCAVAVLQRRSLVVRWSRWVLPAWQGWRAAERLLRRCASLDAPRA